MNPFDPNHNPYKPKPTKPIGNTNSNTPTTTIEQNSDSQNKMSHKENDMHAADGTTGCREQGISLWERLVETDKSLPHFSKISVSHDLTLFANRFIEFLLTVKSLKTGKLYAFGSIPTIFSGWKNALRYENNMKRLSDANFESRFRGLHEKVLAAAFRRAIENNEFVSKASENVRRELATAVSNWILANPRQNKDAFGWRDAAILAIQRQAVGRGGEIQALQWDGTFFNTADDVLDANWIQQKTAKVSRMTFVHDEEWSLSMYVTLGGYIATKNRNVTKKWENIFDDLPDSVSSHVTNTILKRVQGKVPGINKKISSHCYRYGAIDDLNNNQTLDVICSLFRGGWDMEKFCTGFRYFNFRKEDIQASRVLAGHTNPALKVTAPSLSFIKDDSLIEQLKEVADNLFVALPNSEQPGDELYTFKGVLLAASLENVKDMEVKLGRENEYVKRIWNAFKTQGLLWEQVLKIGMFLKQKRSEANEIIREGMDLGYMVHKKMNILLQNQERMENELKASRAREAEKDVAIMELHAKMDMLLAALLPPAQRVKDVYATKRSADDISYSSSKKRKTTQVTHVDDVLMSPESSSISSLDTPENVEAPSVLALPVTFPAIETMQNEEKESETDALASKDAIDESDLNGISNEPKNLFDKMKISSVKLSAKGCFPNWRKSSISSFVEDLFVQKVKLNATIGTNPLALEKKNKNDNNPSEAKKAVKFIVSFCENIDEYDQLVGLENVSELTTKDRRKVGRELGEELTKRANAWYKKKFGKEKQLKLGLLGKDIVKDNTDVFNFQVAHREQWTGIRIMMRKKFAEDKEKAK